jgi:hypothetical protein
MLNINIYEVQENKITNQQIREKMDNILNINQMMELRRTRWLEKLATANSTRNPRKLLVEWMTTPRPSGRPQQIIRHGYARSIEILFPNSKLKTWMPTAQDHDKWAEHVEVALNLPPSTYKPQKYTDTKNILGTQAETQKVVA